MENRSRSSIFTPNELNVGGLMAVSTQLYKHKVALYHAKPRINSLQSPHPHVDVKIQQSPRFQSRPSSAKFSQYSLNSTSRPPQSTRSSHTARSLYQLKFDSPVGFQPIITRKNKKLDKFTFHEHKNNMRNLKMKINSIKSGSNLTERKKNPFDTSVHPTLFFRKPSGKYKPLDYFDLGSKPIIGNQRKLVFSGMPKPKITPQWSPRSQFPTPIVTSTNAFALDTMDAEMYFEDNFQSRRQSSDLFDQLRKSYEREQEY